MSSGFIVDYNPDVCDGHRCPVDCDSCPYQDKARAANAKEQEDNDDD